MDNRLILSAGMPRAGSGWHYNLIHDLVVTGGGVMSRHVRAKYHLERFLTEVNCNLSTLSGFKLLPAYLPVLLGNTYTVKTHAGPTTTANLLLQIKKLVAIYIYRDPRAALLSAFEYGQHAVEQGRTNAFSDLDSLTSAVKFYKLYLQIWEEWNNTELALIVKYEDLLQNFDQEFDRLVKFVGMEGKGSLIEVVRENYRPEMGRVEKRGMHFNIGRSERFREVFTSDQLNSINLAFTPHLIRMGYQI